MIGNYAKRISEIKPFKRLILRNGEELESILQLENGDIKERKSDKNLFFAVDGVLSAVIERIK